MRHDDKPHFTRKAKLVSNTKFFFSEDYQMKFGSASEKTKSENDEI